MAKKTKVITYNLADRGRKYNGQDRSDLDIRSMVNKINSPEVQELVSSGDLFGFNGHEIRARFGMYPPDQWVDEKTGRIIKIQPALRTIRLEADDDGNVVTQHEFLDTDDGQFAARLYASKAGGFSSAINRRRKPDGFYEVTGFHGFDYVRTPNYATNKGDGMFDSILNGAYTEGEACFDSLVELPQDQIVLKEALERIIIAQYDSMQTALYSESLVSHYQREALAAQDALVNAEMRRQKVLERKKQRELDIYDSLICPSKPFDEIKAQWDSFHIGSTSDADLRISELDKVAGKSDRQEERISIVDRFRGL